MSAVIRPYGTWTSPIPASLVARAGVRLSQPSFHGGDVFWVETRPAERGRSVLVRRRPGGRIEDVTPPGFDVRTRCHEYGGGACVLHDGVAFFSRDDDQRLYRQAPGETPVAITPAPDLPRGLRYADARVTPDGRWIVCVRERHRGEGEPVTELVAVPADGAGEIRVLHTGRDFYSSPRVSPDGRRVAWLSWDHPCMPWDGTSLWVAELSSDARISGAELLAGGPGESLFQPGWAPGGALHVVSDRTGWWNLYRVEGGTLTPLAPMAAEFGVPQWVFGAATYAFLGGERIACVYQRDGVHHLGVLERGAETPRPLALPYSFMGHPPELRSDGDDRLLLIAGSPSMAPAVVVVRVDDGAVETVRAGLDAEIDPACVSHPRHVTFPSADGRRAHALFYPPVNPAFAGPPDERPPLLVRSHGGPTSAATSELAPAIQFWTSRGFAVVDVNYGGSTGYGRDYRELLRGRWGIVDTEDCIHAARYLVSEGLADGRRLAIRGGSAGGYTTLCALVFHDTFTAGASAYGVADLEALATDTHKFESRYLDALVGSYPAERDTYQERSPLHHAGRLSCPVIIFQGADDPVVPPSQAEVMVGALRANRLPFAYLLFPGEAHGFRRAETIRAVFEAELAFYGRVFGFEPADELDPITIENLPEPRIEE